MLTAFLRAFRTPDLRRKLLFTVAMIAVFRLGAALPTPGISEKAVHECIGQAAAKGGSVLAVVIPRLETLRQEGQSGQAKITQYTRYLTVGLAILQSTGIVALARSGN